MIKISNYRCLNSQAHAIQQAVKDSDGRFTYCHSDATRTWFGVEFGTSEGYKTFHTIYDQIVNPATYKESTVSSFKKVKNRLVGTIKSWFY